MREYNLIVGATGGIRPASDCAKVLGYTGEVDATTLSVDVSAWDEAFTSATYGIAYDRPDGVGWLLLTNATPTLGIITVTVPTVALDVPGEASIQILATASGDTVKTPMYRHVQVEDSITVGSAPT